MFFVKLLSYFSFFFICLFFNADAFVLLCFFLSLITLLNEFTSYSIGALVFTVFGNGPASVGQVVKTLRQQVLHQHSGCSC